MIQQVPQQSSDLGDMPTPTRGDDGNVLTYDRQLGAYVLKPPPKAERRGGILSYITGNPGPTRLRDLDDVSGTPSGATDGYAYLYDSALDTFVLGEVSTSSTIAGAEDFGGTPGPATDGYTINWDNGAGEFVLTAPVEDTNTTTIADATDLGTTPGAGTDGYTINWDNDAGEFVLSETSGGGGGTPGGSTTQVQYNSSDSFAGHSGFTYDGSGTATLSTALVTPVIKPASDSTAAVQFQTAAGDGVIELDTTNRYFIPSRGTSNTNIFLGKSGNLSFTGTNAIAEGVGAASSITSANGFIAQGYRAGYSATSGAQFIAQGFEAGYSATIRSYWVAQGYRAGYSNDSGDSWIAQGFFAGYSNTSGSSWIAQGRQAGYSNVSGSNWAAQGYQAAYSALGTNFLSIGRDTFRNNTSANLGVALGYRAGYNSQGQRQLFLGYEAGYSETNDNRLHIANSQAKSLLLGDFANNRLAIGYTDLTAPSFTLDVAGTARMTGLRIDQTPTAETPTATHTITVNMNGTDYKLLAVAA